MEVKALAAKADQAKMMRCGDLTVEQETTRGVVFFLYFVVCVVEADVKAGPGSSRRR